MEKNKRNVKHLFDDFVEYNGKIYFVPMEISILCSLDLKSFEIELVSKIPGEDYVCNRGYSGIVAVNDKFYIAPFNSDKIWIYDINLDCWNSVEIKPLDNEYMNSKFYTIFSYKDKVVLLGSFYPAILSLDINTNDVQYDSRMFEGVSNKEEDKIFDCFFRGDYELVDGILYAPCCCSNKLLKYDIEYRLYEWILLDKAAKGYVGIARVGNEVWMPHRAGDKLSIVNTKKEINTLKLAEYNGSKHRNSFAAVEYNDKVYLPALDGFVTLCIDVRTKKVDKINHRFTCLKRISEDVLIGQYREDGRIVRISKGAYEEINPYWYSNKVLDFFDKNDITLMDYLQRVNCIEGQAFVVDDFIAELLKDNEAYRDINENIGKSIWEKLEKNY